MDGSKMEKAVQVNSKSYFFTYTWEVSKCTRKAIVVKKDKIYPVLSDKIRYIVPCDPDKMIYFISELKCVINCYQDQQYLMDNIDNHS